MRYLRLGAVLALLVASVTPALAADPVEAPAPGTLVAQAPPMMFDMWSGWYAGANLGLAFDASSYTLSPSGCTTTSVVCGGGPTLNPLRSYSGNLNGSGFLGGLQAGYNWRFGSSFLFGAETDFDYDGMTSNTTVSAPTLAAPLVGMGPHALNQSQTYLGTARGRIGWLPSENWLLYATGGFAYGAMSSSAVASFSSTPDAYAGRSNSSIKTGWTVGGGVEAAIAPQWTVKAEYLYVDLASTSYNVPCTAGAVACGLGVLPSPGVFYHANLSNNEHIIRIGFNYHFAVPPPPPAPMAMPAPPPAAPKVFIVFFDWDKDTITPEGAAIIQQAADAWKSGAPVQLQVTGYTDRSGSPGYNQRLSERRANNVAKAMAALGVPANEMVVSGRGENDNRVPTAPGVREPQNRRVEIVSP
jgi:outer membrane immunogenic protein